MLHHDRHLLVVDKPHGVLSHPNSAGGRQRAAFEGAYDLKRKCFRSAAGTVWLVHRLDQDTSGVLIGALDEKTADQCRAAFERDEVRKTYLALVSGSPPPEGTWRDCLETSRGAGRVRTVVRHGGRPNAELRFRIVEQSREARLAWLEIDLITGRTHQIRVQAAARRLPLAGDDVYGDFDLNRRLKKTHGIRRLCLHAHRIELPHPASGRALRIESPLPADLSGLRFGS